jgi:hypothetical protein
MSQQPLRALVLNVLAYVVPTFVLGFVWHLVVFESYYRELEIYRTDVIIPFGFTSMLLQGIILAWAYVRLSRDPESISSGLRFAVAAAVLSWTFTTLAVAAKHPMASVARFVTIETAFTLTQFAIVGPLLALSSRLASWPRARPASGPVAAAPDVR